jgi:hypothetical protein
MPLNVVKRINMPSFDEISVKELWPKMQEHEEFMRYFPSKFSKERVPDKTYFFNIMNSVMEGYVSSIIAHTNKVRATKSHEAEAVQTIEITDEWYEKLSSIPFVSCKYKSTLTIYRAQGQDDSSAEGKFQTSSSRKKEKEDSNSRDTIRLDCTHVKAWYCYLITKLITPSFSHKRRGQEGT